MEQIDDKPRSLRHIGPKIIKKISLRNRSPLFSDNRRKASNMLMGNTHIPSKTNIDEVKDGKSLSTWLAKSTISVFLGVFGVDLQIVRVC